MTVQIPGSGCTGCSKLEKRTIKAAEKPGLNASIEKVTEMDKIAEAGIISTPGLLIDGKTALVGRVPSVRELVTILESSQNQKCGYEGGCC